MRSSRDAIQAPQNEEQATEIIQRIQKLDHDIEEIELELSKETADLVAQANEKIQPLQHEREELERALEVYATAHRDTILPPTSGRKSLRVACGRFGWRTGNWCVTIDDEDKLVSELIARGLSEYVSIKKVVNRSMLIKDREKIEHLKIPGVSFQRGERFFVETDKPVAKTEQVPT